MIRYQVIQPDAISPHWLDHFDRKEIVDHFWQYAGSCDKVVLIPSPKRIVDWDDAERKARSMAMRSLLLERPSRLFGAFDHDTLVGFAMIGYDLFGQHQEYLQLYKLHVAQGYRSMGIGKRLFLLALNEAKGTSASKLYISANPAMRAQAFYKKQGAILAKEINLQAQEANPADIQLEIALRLD